MNENEFWSIIEMAWEMVWETAGGKLKARQRMAEGNLSPAKARVLLESLDTVISTLRELLDLLSAEDLLAFDRILERNLYNLDRLDIQQCTDGSDDGFLYARGFIVATGKDYYDAVLAKPSIAMMDFECEEICYVSKALYEEKFGVLPPSEISRESGSNKAGWPLGYGCYEFFPT